MNKLPAPFFRRVFPALAAIVLLAACAPADSNLLYSEDFNSGRTDFPIDLGRDDVQSALDRGNYVLRALQPGTDFWGTAGKDFEDLTLEVSTFYIGGPDDGVIGVICRQMDERRFYLFEITAQGEFAVEKMSGTDYVPLVDWSLSDAIVRGAGARNRLRVTCSGQDLVFRVNDVELARAQDGEYARGDIGLMVGAASTGGVNVSFDELRVTRPSTP